MLGICFFSACIASSGVIEQILNFSSITSMITDGCGHLSNGNS
jgi:hypothetical protein